MIKIRPTEGESKYGIGYASTYAIVRLRKILVQITDTYLRNRRRLVRKKSVKGMSDTPKIKSSKKRKKEGEGEGNASALKKKKKAKLEAPALSPDLRRSPRLAHHPASSPLPAFTLDDEPKQQKSGSGKRPAAEMTGASPVAGKKAAGPPLPVSGPPTTPPDERRKKSKAGKAEKEEKEEEEKVTVDVNQAGGGEQTSWESLGISKRLIKALVEKGKTHAFPVQEKTYQVAFGGGDIVCRAKTGSGKTLAFALPVIMQLKEKKQFGSNLQAGRSPSVLVLAPTRELAKQVAGEFEWLGSTLGLSTFCIYGGMPYGPQQAAIRRGIDVLVGTTGRIKDHLQQKSLKVERVQHVILDEADEMLNMGFAEDVEEVLSQIPGIANKHSATPSTDTQAVQVLLFSATFPSWVAEISAKYLNKGFKEINLVAQESNKSVKTIRHIAIACHWSQRNSVLGDVIACYGKPKGRTIVFCETKKDCNTLAMEESIKGAAQAIHGDISQAQREITLQGFREGRFNTLIATDVAARGIDIQGVDLVICCEPPEYHETYLHRAGRTGRAGRSGTSVVFFTPKQQWYINNIQARSGFKFEMRGVPQGHDLMLSAAMQAREQCEEVSEEVLEHFKQDAEALIASKGAVSALASALAALSGHFKPRTARSLLTSTPGWITVQVTTKAEVRAMSYIWSLIRRYLFPEDSDQKVRGMRLMEDGQGALFDIPEEERELVEKVKTPPYISIEICKELPELKQSFLALQRPEKKRWGGGSRSGSGRGGSRGSSRGGSRGGSRGASRRGRGSDSVNLNQKFFLRILFYPTTTTRKHTPTPLCKTYHPALGAPPPLGAAAPAGPPPVLGFEVQGFQQVAQRWGTRTNRPLHFWTKIATAKDRQEHQ
eukprot:g70630.t1